MPRRRTTLLALLLITIPVYARPAAAFGGCTRRGSTYLTGDGSLYYENGAHMVGPLAVFVAFFAALVEADDDDGTDASATWAAAEYDGCCGYHGRGRGHFSMEAFQVGSSAGVFLAPDLAVGLRLVAQTNDEDDPVQSYWGAGPEIAWHPGSPISRLRPFLSAGALYTRGRLRDPGGSSVGNGPSLQFRAGLSWLGPEGGFFVQCSHQTAPHQGALEAPVTRSGWGAGMGITFFLN